jgi:hypothetical protein
VAVHELADVAREVSPTHLLVENHERVVLSEHVGQAGLLDGADEFDALGQCEAGAGLAHHMLARVECAHREGRVLVEVVREDHRVHVMAEELVEVGVSRDPELLPGLLELFLPRVAERDQFHAQMRTRAAREASPAPHSDHANSYVLHMTLLLIRP